MKPRRPVWLWAFALWTLGLGTIGVWRATVLWRERALLFALGSSLSPTVLTLVVLTWGLSGLGLIVSALGLWWRHSWARQSARIGIPLYFAAIQAYVWLFVRSGLMWERRWISLVLAVFGSSIGAGTLTWRKTRKWLRLQ